MFHHVAMCLNYYKNITKLTTKHRNTEIYNFVKKVKYFKQTCVELNRTMIYCRTSCK